MRTSLSNNIAMDLPSSALTPEAASPGPLVLSPRLHNRDLAPTKVEGRGGQIQCDIVREAWTHSGRLQRIGSQAADGKVYVCFVFIVYKAHFTLSHMRASFRSMKTLVNFVFIGSVNN